MNKSGFKICLELLYHYIELVSDLCWDVAVLAEVPSPVLHGQHELNTQLLYLYNHVCSGCSP
jgi:hypothetical protein